MYIMYNRNETVTWKPNANSLFFCMAVPKPHVIWMTNSAFQDLRCSSGFDLGFQTVFILLFLLYLWLIANFKPFYLDYCSPARQPKVMYRPCLHWIQKKKRVQSSWRNIWRASVYYCIWWWSTRETVTFLGLATSLLTRLNVFDLLSFVLLQCIFHRHRLIL